jgi:hypothetical protein
MLDPFILIKGIMDGRNDPNLPVLMDLEQQRPGFRRRQAVAVAGLCLLAAVLLFWMLMGWEIYL